MYKKKTTSIISLVHMTSIYHIICLRNKNFKIMTKIYFFYLKIKKIIINERYVQDGDDKIRRILCPDNTYIQE